MERAREIERNFQLVHLSIGDQKSAEWLVMLVYTNLSLRIKIIKRLEKSEVNKHSIIMRLLFMRGRDPYKQSIRCAGSSVCSAWTRTESAPGTLVGFVPREDSSVLVVFSLSFINTHRIEIRKLFKSLSILTILRISMTYTPWFIWFVYNLQDYILILHRYMKSTKNSMLAK